MPSTENIDRNKYDFEYEKSSLDDDNVIEKIFTCFKEFFKSKDRFTSEAKKKELLHGIVHMDMEF